MSFEVFDEKLHRSEFVKLQREQEWRSLVGFAPRRVHLWQQGFARPNDQIAQEVIVANSNSAQGLALGVPAGSSTKQGM